MAPGEPSADQETRGYQPPEAFAFSPPLSSFFHEEKNAHPRTQPDSSKEASRTERNEAAGVRARPPSSYHSAAGGQGSESSRTPQERGGGGGGASAESRGAKRQEKERRAGADRGHERDEDRQQESKTRREQTRRERTTDEFWRPPSYDVWGAGLTMLKIVLGDLEPLVVQDDRIRSKVQSRTRSRLLFQHSFETSIRTQPHATFESTCLRMSRWSASAVLCIGTTQVSRPSAVQCMYLRASPRVSLRASQRMFRTPVRLDV